MQEQNALVSEEKVLSELEKEPVIEPETVHINAVHKGQRYGRYCRAGIRKIRRHE